MPRQSVRFAGVHGELAGALELPATAPRGYALFAHCFSCGKNSIAASRISRSLAEHGIAVLRFDFTGLGESEGDFGNSGFSADVADLVAAADFLREQYAAPTLLIGHSLGGTAVLAAAGHIPEASAVVTIGAPSSPEHVVEHFGANVEAIRRDGEADVSLAGRPFRITRDFLDDLYEHSMAERVRNLRRALLVMHSPLDDVVEIDEAGEIFGAALHPKSFISLDKADHLLTDAGDAEYAAAAIAGWADRYFAKPAGEEPAGEGVDSGHVAVREANRRFLRNIASDDHRWLSDEPERVGGDNLGPDPYELLLASLGACTSMTLRMYGNHKRWPVEDIHIELSHGREHVTDCENCEEQGHTLETLTRSIRIEGDLSEDQRRRLLEIADRCPVHKTLTGKLRIETEVNE